MSELERSSRLSFSCLPSPVLPFLWSGRFIVGLAPTVLDCVSCRPSFSSDRLPATAAFVSCPTPPPPGPAAIWPSSYMHLGHGHRPASEPPPRLSILPAFFSRSAKFRRMYFRSKSVFRTVATLCGCEASGSPGRDGRHGRRDRGRSPGKSPLPQLSLHGRWPARAPSWVAAVLPRTARLAAAPHDGGGERGTTVILSVSEGRLGGDGARLAAFWGGWSGAAADGDSCSGRQ